MKCEITARIFLFAKSSVKSRSDKIREFRIKKLYSTRVLLDIYEFHDKGFRYHLNAFCLLQKSKDHIKI